MKYHIIKELPTGVVTKVWERGGRIEVKYKTKQIYENTIEQNQHSKS